MKTIVFFLIQLIPSLGWLIYIYVDRPWVRDEPAFLSVTALCCLNIYLAIKLRRVLHKGDDNSLLGLWLDVKKKELRDKLEDDNNNPKTNTQSD
jgi:hypothetical protein